MGEGDFAETVLLPGDPLRAKFIADTYFEDAKLVTSIRNCYGYTGTYKGMRISVMATGMGIGSSQIYATELCKFYGVKNLIRVGSCGAFTDDVKCGDLVFAMGACSDSNVNRVRFKGYEYSAIADFELLRTAVASAERKGAKHHVGNIYSSDFFYNPDEDIYKLLAKFNVLGVEMEAFGLYGVCAEYGARGLCVCTVSDEILAGNHMTPEDRQTKLHMMEVVLDACVDM